MHSSIIFETERKFEHFPQLINGKSQITERISLLDHNLPNTSNQTSANKEMLKMISLLTQTFFKPWIISGHVHTVTHTGTVLQKDAVGMRWAGAYV